MSTTEQQTDPVVLGWMTGFPPAPDKTIAFADESFREFPKLRWSWSNMRQLVPTKAVWRGTGGASVIPRMEQDLSHLEFSAMDGSAQTLASALQATYADGFIVLHRGRIIYERYFGALAPHQPHIAMSVTKSFTGILTGILVAEGAISPNASVLHYVPDLAGSAFADATVQQVLDMTTGLKYSEIYTDRNSDVWALRRANGTAPYPHGETGPALLDFLCQQQKAGSHGNVFAYKTVNTDVLAWITRRVSGQSLSDLLSARIWQPMGAEEDAYYVVDRVGIESGGGGLNTTLRDLARFGELVRTFGASNGRQVFPSRVIEDLIGGGDREKFAPAGYPTLKGWSYHNQWWFSHNEGGAFMARGVHGQSLYIDPKAEVVIARYGSHPAAGNVANDPISLPAFAAIARALS